MYINNYFTGFIDFPGEQLPLVGMFRSDLVALSVIVAICGAWAALACQSRADSLLNRYPGSAMLWKVAGGIGFGGAIWGMHFVGMLAFSLPCGISYDFLLTALSVVPGILASLTAMAVVGRADFGLYTRLSVGAVLMGVGIGAMHYAGMAAMRLPAILMYEPVIVAFSVAAAVGLSFVALYFVEHGRLTSPYPRTRQLVAAAILGSAVASMHYIAMQAAIFYPTLEGPETQGQLSQGLLAVLVGLGTLVLAGAVAVASFAARLRQTARDLAKEVDQRIEAEKEALAGEARLQAIFDTAVEAIVVIDRDGLIRQWSHSAETIFGYAAEEALGRNVAMIMDGIDPAAHDRYLRRYQETGKASIIGIGREVTGLRRDGSTVPIELTVGEMNLDGEIFYAGVLRDITARKRMQEKLIEAERDRQAAELRSNFLAHMSHEMRTPLNAILGFAELMKAETFGPLNDTYKTYSNDIFFSGSHLLELVNALLDLSKIEQNALNLNVVDVAVPGVMEDAVKLLDEQVKEKRIALSMLVDSDLPETIRTDRGKLYQVLINLLTNAIKYTPDGGRISLRAWPSGECVKILVEDAGVGMSEAEIERALTPFGQVREAFTADVSGTGLGLPIVVSFVDLLHGELKIDSKKGEGTAIHIRLPIAFPGEEQAIRNAGA